jgi:hypothetical protein
MKSRLSQHSQHSSYREKLIEHLFIGELLKIAWKSKGYDLEVAKPEVDNAGYDLIIEAAGVLRHVQLKSSFLNSSTSSQKIHVALASKPSGCVVWVYFNEETLSLGPFRIFGNEAGMPLTDIQELKVAKHTKGNSLGEKIERPNIRVVNKGSFTEFESIEDVYDFLFYTPMDEVIKRGWNNGASKNEDLKIDKIALWAQRPHQINHRIIRAYLELYKKASDVKKNDLKKLCEEKYDLKTFETNFASLKTDSGHSHGKVFKEDNGVVAVYDNAWREIKSHFEK